MTKFNYKKYPAFTYGGPGSTSISFSLSPDPKKYDRQLTIPLATCRDHVNDAVIAEMNGVYIWNHKDTDPHFDMKKLRLIVVSSISDDPYIKAAKSILNIYGDIAGFTGRCKIAPISIEDITSKTMGAWLITGPKEWMRCTQLISMCTLITRICKAQKIDPKMIKDLDSVEKVWSGMKTAAGSYSGDVKYMLPFCWPKWRVLVENFNNIFKRLGPKSLYPATGVGAWHGPGGIFSLCKHQTGITRLDERFKEACVAAGVKQVEWNQNDYYR